MNNGSYTDIKATLRSRDHVNGSVHRGTAAATSTTTGLILPVLDWALGHILVVSHSYTSMHRMIIVQEHMHSHTVAKCYSSPSLYFPKPAHFSLHCTVLKENICLPFKSSSAHHHHHVLCPKAGPALQADKPRLQFCRRTANSGTKAAVLLGI